jgi:cytochrome c biogenesis protein CcdA
MSGYLLAAGAALWLGVLTSVNPCPLATNIAAVSFVGRRVGSPLRVLLAGTLYTLGRALTFLVLGALLVGSLLSAPHVSHFLQKHMNRLLGPILILVGMVLLELIPLRLPTFGVGARLQKRIESWEMGGAFVLGVLFALSLCPLSAAIFFGSLLPLAVQHGSRVVFPALYGAGTGLPVLLFAAVAALGAQQVARAYEKVAVVEKWARRVTGVLFIGVGIYLALTYIFGVFG